MSDLTGELIDGRYQLLRQVANGGMATIYEALDTRLDRKVAVKIMHAHLAQDEAFVSRFIREAKAAAALTHPNIVAVQDQGWNQSGIPAVFLVMEFIEGHTLREYLNERGRFEGVYLWRQDHFPKSVLPHQESDQEFVHAEQYGGDGSQCFWKNNFSENDLDQCIVVSTIWVWIL